MSFLTLALSALGKNHETCTHDTAHEGLNRLIEQGRFEEAHDASLAMATTGVTSAQMTLGWLYQVGKGAGVWRIPLGLARLVRLGWITFKTASRNLEDDLLFRL